MNNVLSSALSLSPLVLAQFSGISESELGRWCLIGAAVMVMANQGFCFFRNATGGFAKKRGESAPTSDDCEKKHAAITAEFTLLRKEEKAEREKLHNRINTISDNVSFIRGKFEGK